MKEFQNLSSLVQEFEEGLYKCGLYEYPRKSALSVSGLVKGRNNRSWASSAKSSFTDFMQEVKIVDQRCIRETFTAIDLGYLTEKLITVLEVYSGTPECKEIIKEGARIKFDSISSKYLKENIDYLENEIVEVGVEISNIIKSLNTMN
jgi:hypothetical protein